MLKALPPKWGVPPLLAKAKEGGPPHELKGPRHTSVMALLAHPLLARQYYGGYYCMVAFVVSGLHLSKSSLGSGYSLLKPNDKLQGVSRSVRLKTATMRQSPDFFLLISIGNKFCTFGVGICELVHLGYPGAQRARRRGIVHDLGSPPRGSPTISEKL